MFLEKYTLTLFGQRITRVNQVTSTLTGTQMQILDNGYLRILLQLGLVTFIVFLTILLYTLYQSLRHKHYAVTIGILALAFYTVSEYFISSVFCNIFFFFFMYYRYGIATESAVSSTETANSFTADTCNCADTPACYVCLMPDTHNYLRKVWQHRVLVVVCACIIAVFSCLASLLLQTQATRAYWAAYPDGKQEIVLSLSSEELPIVQKYLSEKQAADLTGLDSLQQQADNTYNTLTDNAKKYLKKYHKYELTDPSQPIVYREKVPTVWVSKRKAARLGIEGGILGGTFILYLLFLCYVYQQDIFEKSYNTEQSKTSRRKTIRK